MSAPNTLWVNGSEVDMYLAEHPTVTSPILKRQTVDVPGGQGLLDLTVANAYHERQLMMLVASLDTAEADRVAALQGQIANISASPLWSQGYWRGRVRVLKHNMWGAEARIALQVAVHPWLYNRLEHQTEIMPTGDWEPFSARPSRQSPSTVIQVHVYGGHAVVSFERNGGTVQRLLPEGVHSLTEWPASYMKPLTGVVRSDDATVTFMWRERELWSG